MADVDQEGKEKRHVNFAVGSSEPSSPLCGRRTLTMFGVLRRHSVPERMTAVGVAECGGSRCLFAQPLSDADVEELEEMVCTNSCKRHIPNPVAGTGNTTIGTKLSCRVSP